VAARYLDRRTISSGVENAVSRRCEVWSAGSGGWSEIAFAALEPDMVFRLFEDDGTPVIEENADTGDRVSKWRVVSAPHTNENGRLILDREPIPETDVERALRTGGMHWPNDRQPPPGPWVPSRLR